MGPREQLPAGFAIENLGTASDLGPGEERDWRIDWHGTGVRPVISFALSYLDRDRRRIHFDVFQVRFAGDQVSISAGYSKEFTARRLRWRALRERKWRATCVFFSPRRRSVEGLIIDQSVREALGLYLDRQLQKKLKWGSGYEASMAEF